MLPEDPEHLNDPSPVENPILPKKKSRAWVWILMILLVGVISWFIYWLSSSSLMSGPRINPLNLIPSDAVVILETNRPYDVWTELNETEIWEILQRDPEWKKYGEQLASVEATLSDFDQVLNVLTNRTVYFSAHQTRRSQLDYLIVLDMNGLAALRTWLTRGENITRRQFKEKTIYEQYDPGSRETFYFSFENNFLIGSLTHTLIEASILEQEDGSLNRSLDFIDIRKKVRGDGLIRMYLNYESLFSFITTKIGTEEGQVIKDQLPFLFSGLFFDIKEEALLLEGYSNYADSLDTYLSLMSSIGEGRLSVSSIAPAQTSVLFSLGFDSFTRFYEELQERLKEDEEISEDYTSYSKKTEKFLDISIADDIVDWVDDEMAVIQIESEAFSSQTALLIKAKKASLAKEKMDFLNRQVRRKTPVRFKEVDYRGYTINFMSVKGLFNLLLGNLFKRFDRPYYTIIEEYVIFSNQPNVLRSIIDSYIADNTLDQTPSFRQFKEELGTNHCALLYVQPPLLERTNTGLLDEGTIQLMKSKQSILSSFPQLGFTISPSGRFFKTRTLLSIESIKIQSEALEIPTLTLDYDSIWRLDPGDQIEVTEIEIVDLGAKKQSESFEEGLPKYEVDIKDGLKHGNYFEYYESGELKVKGKYKNDLKDGTWKYFDINGKLIRREKYKQGVLAN